ncbi:MAG: 5-dehydro-2-deoxygluconokinase [Rhizobiaceae bacterium]
MDQQRFRRNQFLVVGRAGMDLYADPPGSTIENAKAFQSALGGSAANIAAGICRLGGQASLLTAVSDDAVGRYICAQLADYGIDARFVVIVKGEPRASLAVVETRADNCQSVIYRNNAADLQLSGQHTGHVNLEDFGALIVTGTALAMEPSRSAVFDLLHRANLAKIPVVIDLDYRPYSWTSNGEAKRICLQIADLADIIVGNDVEFDLIAGTKGGGLELANQLATKPGVIAIHKLGERGSVTFFNGGVFELPVFPVVALKPTGAGDAFLAGFCTAFASGHSVHEALRQGSAAAAIVVTRVGCAPASPTAQELSAFLATQTAN